MARYSVPIWTAGIVLVVSISHIQAGVYSPHEPILFTIRPDGTAEELHFGTQSAGPFRLRFVELLNIADQNPARRDNPDRKKVVDRVTSRKTTSSQNPLESAALAADFIRLRQTEDALNILTPHCRSRTPDFRVLANLAHVHAVRGEWNEAARWHELAAFEIDIPTDLPGASPEQRKWLQKVERQYYSKWLQIHRQRINERLTPENEEIFPLFAIRFVNEKGVYEPGQLAAAERAKLPPDAIAIVQQLLLWAPEWDPALYWLLAELYAANGKIREAKVIFDQCVEARQYSNRRVFMANRKLVWEAESRLPPEKSVDDVPIADGMTENASKPDEVNPFLPSRDKVILVGAIFGFLALLLLVMQVRAIVRRVRSGAKPRSG